MPESLNYVEMRNNLKDWTTENTNLADTKDHLPVTVVRGISEVMLNEINFTESMELFIDGLKFAKESNILTSEERNYINSYLKKVEKLFGDYKKFANLNVLNNIPSPEKLIDFNLERYKSDNLAKVVDELGILTDEYVKILSIHDKYTENRVTKPFFKIANSSSREEMGVLDVPSFAIMPMQKLPRLSMPFTELAKNLKDFEQGKLEEGVRKFPDYHIPEGEIPSGTNQAIRDLMEKATTTAQLASNLTTKFNAEKALRDDAIKAAQNDFEETTSAPLSIINLKINSATAESPLQAPLSKTETQLKEPLYLSIYLQNLLKNSDPEHFTEDPNGKYTIRQDDKDNTIYHALGIGKKTSISLRDNEIYLNPANFDPNRLDQLSQRNPQTSIWRVLKTTIPVSDTFDGQKKLRAYIDAAQTIFMQEKVKSQDKWNAIYGLFTSAQNFASNDPELFDSAFGANSKIGAWLLDKSPKAERTSIRQSMATKPLASSTPTYRGKISSTGSASDSSISAENSFVDTTTASQEIDKEIANIGQALAILKDSLGRKHQEVVVHQQESDQINIDLKKALDDKRLPEPSEKEQLTKCQNTLIKLKEDIKNLRATTDINTKELNGILQKSDNLKARKLLQELIAIQTELSQTEETLDRTDAVLKTASSASDAALALISIRKPLPPVEMYRPVENRPVENRPVENRPVVESKPEIKNKEQIKKDELFLLANKLSTYPKMAISSEECQNIHKNLNKLTPPQVESLIEKLGKIEKLHETVNKVITNLSARRDIFASDPKQKIEKINNTFKKLTFDQKVELASMSREKIQETLKNDKESPIGELLREMNTNRSWIPISKEATTFKEFKGLFQKATRSGSTVDLPTLDDEDGDSENVKPHS